MRSRHLVCLIVILVSPLLLNAQESKNTQESKKPTYKERHEHEDCEDKSSARSCSKDEKREPVTIHINCGSGDKAKPHTPHCTYICRDDTVKWQLDKCKGIAEGDFLILFDGELSPLSQQFFVGNQPPLSVKEKAKSKHHYHYTVWFQNGESEDPHIIIR